MVGSVLPLRNLCQGCEAQQTVTSCFLEAGTMKQDVICMYLQLLFLFREQKVVHPTFVCNVANSSLENFLSHKSPFIYLFLLICSCIFRLISGAEYNDECRIKETTVIWISCEEIHSSTVSIEMLQLLFSLWIFRLLAVRPMFLLFACSCVILETL